MDQRMSKLTKMLQLEQERLWYDLFWALRHAANGQWSVEAEGKTKRILLIASEVGITPWEKVQIPLLASGVYNTIRMKLGFSAATFDLEEGEHTKFPPGWLASCRRIKDLDLDEILNDFTEEEV
jgi:hypothetical protein